MANRIIFFGAGAFGIPALKMLVNQKTDSLVAVVTAPDRPKGRNRVLSACPIKLYCDEIDQKTLSPSNPNAPDFLKQLEALKPDIFVVVDYGHILSQELLGIARIMPINIHASILPKYRGASPMQASLLSGDSVTGISLIRMSTRMDAGDILWQRTLEIAPDECLPSLYERLSQLGSAGLTQAMRDIDNNNIKLQVQDERLASYCKKISKADGLMDANSHWEIVYRRYRAYKGWPGTYFFIHDKRVVIHEALFEANPALPGGMQLAAGRIDASPDNQTVDIHLTDGIAHVKALQVEGKSTVLAADFIRGYREFMGQHINT